MGYLPGLVYVSFLAELLPLGAGIYYWARSPPSLRILTGLLLYGALSNIALVLLAFIRGNNMVLLHFYTLVSFLLIVLLFSYWQQRRAARFMRLSIPIFFIIYILLSVLGYENFQTANKYSLSIQGVFIAFISLYTLYNTLRHHIDYPVYRDERFWVSFGVFFNHAGNVLVYAAIPIFITHALWQIHNVVVIVGNIFYFGAYLCLRK
jgi:hypothetical protein